MDLSGLDHSCRVCRDFFKKRGTSQTADPEPPKECPSSVPSAANENSSPNSPEADSVPLIKLSQVLMFEELCSIFEAIEATTKRLLINDILTDYFLKLMQHYPNELVPAIYLCLCRLGPSYEGLELGLGEALLMKAIANATGRPLAALRSDFEEMGDIGMLAQASRSNQSTMFKPKRLSCAAIFKTLHEIATASGQSAVNKKIEKIRSLLVACEGSEAKFLFRMLAGKLRIGLAEQSVLIALAHAGARICPNSSEASSEDLPVGIIKSVFNSLPNYEIVVPLLLKHGIWDLPRHCGMVPGVPLKPMLAHPTKSLSQVLDRFEALTFTCEYKYDGERAQIHRLEDGRCYIFSRNQENMSQKYPDVMEKLGLIVKPGVSSFVLDCEVVAFDPKAQKILPFQILSTRKRKDVTVDSVEVQVVLFGFDLLYLNGKELLKEPFRVRRQLLHDSFAEVAGEFYHSKSLDSSAIEDIQAFLDEAVQSSCEGLMVKTLDTDSSYEPSKRSRNWLKVKKDYLEGIGDSLDLVVMGGYTGRGKRTGVYGGYLLGCYDPDAEEFQAICKLGTGFSEQDLETLAAELKPLILKDGPKNYYRFGEGVKPDVWFDAQRVWEVKAADFSLSPVYLAAVGLVDAQKGVSLRFPRFIRDRSGDKTPEDATSASQVAEMYQQQAVYNKANQAGADEAGDEYY